MKIKKTSIHKVGTGTVAGVVVAVITLIAVGSVPAAAASCYSPAYVAMCSVAITNPGGTGGPPPHPTGDQCGGSIKGHQYAAVYTDFNFGCKGKGNAIVDLTFAIVRFLTTGVGFVLVASMAWAGIQYTGSRGDPQATAKAVHRIRSNVIALAVFLFAYAILNYVIPGQVLG